MEQQLGTTSSEPSRLGKRLINDTVTPTTSLPLLGTATLLKQRGTYSFVCLLNIFLLLFYSPMKINYVGAVLQGNQSKKIRKLHMDNSFFQMTHRCIQITLLSNFLKSMSASQSPCRQWEIDQRSDINLLNTHGLSTRTQTSPLRPLYFQFSSLKDSLISV